MIRKIATTMFMSAALIGMPALVGCDRTVSEKKTVTDSPSGTTVKKEEPVKKSDGSIEKTTEKKTVPNP